MTSPYYDWIIASLKLTAAADPNELSYCQRLDHYSRELHFQSYHHLSRSLRNLPESVLQPLVENLVLILCRVRFPRSGRPYFGGMMYEGLDMRFNTRWIGFDSQSEEVRIPCNFTYEDLLWIKGGNGSYGDYQLHIIERKQELVCVFRQPRVLVMLSEEVAKELFPLRFNRHHRVVD